MEESLATVSGNSRSNFFISYLSLFSPSTPNLQGLKATKASVELNQSAWLLMTSCLQLDSLPGRAGRARDPAWKGTLAAPFHTEGSESQGSPSATLPFLMKPGTFPKSLARNYSRFVQNAHKARHPWSSPVSHLFNIYES